MKIAIIVHGGAGRIPDDEHEAHKAGCRRAVLAGYELLAKGGTAIDAVETAVMIMEDDPTFDAGTGSHLNQAGTVQLDSGMMDGATLQVGAIAGVEGLKNPIQVARRLLDSPYNFFVGAGAVEWAKSQGIMPINPADLIVPREQARYERKLAKDKHSLQADRPSDTVGAVAIDRAGNLVAGTSTGGTMFKPVGRVGDSPLPGCGYHADNLSAAVSTTGHGESNIRVQLARTAADFAMQLADEIATCSLAAEKAVQQLGERVGGRGGLIMIDRAGRIGLAYNTPNMAYAFLIEGMNEPETYI
jgi:beta-aspartyl-peptidase (threonine type)